MMCLRNFLLFLIVLPFSAASPLFMFTFITTMWLKLRPCLYCTAVLVIFFFAVSTPSYLSLSFPEDPYRHPSSRPYIVDENSTLLEQAFKGNETAFLYSAPATNRSWVDLNYGRLLWPKLEGYRLLDSKPSEKKGSFKTSSAIKAVLQEQEQEHNPLASRTEEVEPREPAAPHVSSSSATVEATQKPRRGWFDWSKTSFLEKGTVHVEERRAKPASSAHVADPEPPAEPESTGYYRDEYEEDFAESSHRDFDDEPTINHRLPWYAYIMHPSQIPSRYDLRVNGVGFLLDLGMSRNEQAVKQEVREWKAWEAEKKRRKSEKAVGARRDAGLQSGQAGLKEEL